MRKSVKRFVYFIAVIILLLVLALTGYFMVKNADWEDLNLDLSNLPDINFSGDLGDLSGNWGDMSGDWGDMSGLGGNINMGRW